MIRFQHTVFALPFAFIGALLAARGWPSLGKIFWILLACVFARSAAMSFNRVADESFDRLNPRTRGWALPQGLLTRRFVIVFSLVNCAGFVFAASHLNGLAFALSPVALIVLLGYSLTKRFTSFSHYFLGGALGLAPIGAWIAVRGDVALVPILLGLAVLFWTAGFDIIYSCQDYEFDLHQPLFSIPKTLGVGRALQVSALTHVVAFVL
ncbi:MAG: UbiA-like polyprenyltransferase, partial [bacterium]